MRNPLIQNKQSGVSFNDFMSKFQQFSGNPMQMLSQSGLNIPQGITNPNDIIQHLMNSGKLSQEQYAQIQQTAQRIRNNPMFQQQMQMMGKK